MVKSKNAAGYALADKLQGAKPSAYIKKLRKESDSKEKAHEKQHAKYLKERAKRYKKEGITG